MMFDSMEEVRLRLESYAQQRSLRVGHDNHNDRKAGLAKVAFHCWCSNPPKQTTNGALRKAYHADLGKVNCNCAWSVGYHKYSSDWQFRSTYIMEQQTGHSSPEPRQSSTSVAARQMRHLRTQEGVPQPMVNKCGTSREGSWCGPGRNHASLACSTSPATITSSATAIALSSAKSRITQRAGLAKCSQVGSQSESRCTGGRRHRSGHRPRPSSPLHVSSYDIEFPTQQRRHHHGHNAWHQPLPVSPPAAGWRLSIGA